jgi:hypothetical protein
MARSHPRGIAMGVGSRHYRSAQDAPEIFVDGLPARQALENPR